MAGLARAGLGQISESTATWLISLVRPGEGANSLPTRPRHQSTAISPVFTAFNEIIKNVAAKWRTFLRGRLPHPCPRRSPLHPIILQPTA